MTIGNGHSVVSNVLQGLKPSLIFSTYGTAEAVPLSKTRFFRKLLIPESHYDAGEYRCVLE